MRDQLGDVDLVVDDEDAQRGPVGPGQLHGGHRAGVAVRFLCASCDAPAGPRPDRGPERGGLAHAHRRPGTMADIMSTEPVITYPPELPVSQRRDDIAAAIRDHQVVIVAGETGSGKTTQLPKICLELGRGAAACRRGRQADRPHPAAPDRRPLGRRADRRGARHRARRRRRLPGPLHRPDRRAASRVKLMTDGILLAELQRDRDAAPRTTRSSSTRRTSAASTSTSCSATCEQLLPRRPDLKVIITSATIDPERFAAHFAEPRRRPAPIIEVSGRTYPVEVRYRPLVELVRGGRGGRAGRPRPDRGDRRRGPRALAPRGRATCWSSCPASARSATPPTRSPTPRAPRRGGARGRAALRAALAPPSSTRSSRRTPRRRVVLATNVAETSLTVPGIRYVVDTGVARISRYSVRTKVQRLPIEPISQASANQRSGPLRPGRGRHRDPALRRGGLRGAARSSPTRRSCARTWPR